jgi:hypothetical protein
LPDGKQKNDFASFDPGLDTFNYLMMTGRRAWPTTPQSSWFGNWVDNKDEHGRIAIARNLFVESFLLKKLEAVVLQSKLTFSDKKAEAAWNISYKMTPWHSGYGGSFKSSQTLGVYTSHTEFSEKLELDGPLYAQDHKWKVTHDANVTILPGGKTIAVSGTSTISCDITNWGGFRDHAASTVWWRQRQLTWASTITLGSVTEGGLTASVSDVNYVDTPTDGGDWLAEMFGSIDKLFGSQSDNFLSAMKNAFSNAIQQMNLKQVLERNLNGSSMFIFPGGQEFKISNPIFNNELDLLANIKYEFY